MGWLTDLVDATVSALDFLPDAIVVMLLAFSPLGEVRLSVPVGMLVYCMSWGEAAVWSLFGNLLVAPAAVWLYPRLEQLVRKWGRGDRFLDRVYARTHGKEGGRVERWKEAAVALFIAVPLPGSGAWAGVLLAHIFGMHWKHTWRYYYAGVAAATALVTFLVATGRFFFIGIGTRC